MLDILDFQEEKGGDLKKVLESQRRRYASATVVEDVVATFEDMKRSIINALGSACIFSMILTSS